MKFISIKGSDEYHCMSALANMLRELPCRICEFLRIIVVVVFFYLQFLFAVPPQKCGFDFGS